MRIAIVTATLQPDWMYIENLLAGVLPKAGHTVRVISGGRKPQAPEFVALENGQGYELQRVRCFRLPHHVFVSYPGIRPALEDFRPDMIHWVGPTSYFGWALLQAPKLKHIPVVSFFSESVGWHEFDWRKRGIGLKARLQALAYRLLRAPMVRAACRRSTLIVGVTPETVEILQGLFRPGRVRDRQRGKMVMLPLGFHPRVTNWAPKTRDKVRKEFGFSDSDVVVCASSRFVPNKAPLLKMLMTGLQRAMTADPRIKGLVIGLTDNDTSMEIRRLIEEGQFSERFSCHEFTDQARLNALYNASDIALFGNCSNSCQAALGTGAFACFAGNGTMDHLITRPDQGVFFRPGDPGNLAEKLAEASRFLGDTIEDRLVFRAQLAKASQWLGYDKIIEALMQRAEERLCS